MNPATRIGRSAALAAALAWPCTLSAQDPLTVPGVEPGPYPVGFETLHEYDHARTYRGPWDEQGQPQHNARPMLISVWYPATANDGATTRPFGDYVSLIANVESFRPVTAEHRAEIHRAFATNDSGQVDAAVESVLATHTRALWRAERRPGRYPLLVSSTGGPGPPHEDAFLWEYLASHGYIVAQIPSYARRTFTKGDVAFDLPGVEVGVRDLEFTYARMRRYPNVDPNRFGVLDHSWGGLASAAFVGRNHNVGAVVSLDGGNGFADLFDGLEQYPQFRPERMHAPFLHLISKQLWDTDRFRGDYHPRIPHEQVFVMKFTELTHSEFASAVLLQNVHRAGVTSEVRDAKYREFAVIARYTLAFLEAYLRGDGEHLRFLERALTDTTLANMGVRMTRSGAPRPAGTNQ